jgi:hypothetical protein
MSIGCPSMRWFLGLFLCRLVPVRRWLQTFILWLSDLLSVGLRQWNHHWIDTGSWKWMLSAVCCWGSPLDSEGDQCTMLSNCMIRPRSFKWVAVTRTYCWPDGVGIVWDPSDFVSEVDLLVFRLTDGCCQPFVAGAASLLTKILSYQNLFVVSSMVKSINYFWVLPTLSIRVKGKRLTLECWIVSRFFCSVVIDFNDTHINGMAF